ncbi:Nucleolin [Orbilia brochopaga]|nr:Nucleolin [Drechslerella brochopaga]
MANKHWEQDKDATVYIGNLDERVSDAIVWELMLQAGRIVNVHLPKDRVTQTHQGFGFVEFMSEEDAEYAARIMNQIRLYGKPIRVNKASADKQKTVEVGAELFIGNLDSMVDEKTLYDTFMTFGTITAPPKIARDDNGISRGFGFVSFDSFESSDKAVEAMNNQFLMNKEISVSYAFKKDGKGERHGDQAERLLASQARKNNVHVQVQALPAALLGQPPNGPPTTQSQPSSAATAPSGLPATAPPQHPHSAPQSQAVQQGYSQPQMPHAQPPHQGYPPQPPAGYPPQGYNPQPQYQNPQASYRPPPGGPPPAHGLPSRPPPPLGFGGQPGYGAPAQPPPAGFAQAYPPAGFAQATMGRGAAVPPYGVPPPGAPPMYPPAGAPYGSVPPPPAGFNQRR